MIPPCLTLSIIRYVSRVKWSNPGKGVVPSSTPQCSSYWKESLLVALDYGCQLYLFICLKHSFFQAEVVSILLYVCTTWTLTKRLEKKLDGNYTRMLQAILNMSWQQNPTKHQLYGRLPPITKIIKVRQTRHAGHCWRSRDELLSDVLLWAPTYGQARAGRPARTYIQQICEDSGCGPEDQPEVMKDREKWRERVKDICASGTTQWWWWWYIQWIPCNNWTIGF